MLSRAFFSSKFRVFFSREVGSGRAIIDRRKSDDIALAEMSNRRQRAGETASFNTQAHRNAEEKNRPASEIYLQVLGNGYKGSARSLFVFTDQWRYMFNCSEGTQRLANEYKAKLSRLDHVFVTHRCWENVGGLPGLVLTIQNIGVPKITLHGPPNIEKLFQMTKGFMLTDNIDIVKKNVADGPYHDHIMSVDYVMLSRTKTEINRERQIDETISATEIQQPLKRQRLSPVTDEEDISVAYVCRATSKPGQLLLEKCVEQNVPPGPLLGQLKSGKDVTLPSGKIVKSSDVVSPVEPGPVFIVVECPSLDFLDSLLETEAFAPYQAEASSPEDVAAVVVHFTPTAVIEHSKYQEWMNRFHSSTDHLILNDDNVGPSSFAVHRIQHKLNILHSRIFPLLTEDTTSAHIDSDDSDSGLRRVVHSPMSLKYHLRPMKRIDKSSVVTLSPDVFVQECFNIAAFPGALSELKSTMEQLDKTRKEQKYPEIVFLGTGSSIPSKVRNTSGILVNISEEKSILMDCGEATYSQMYRFYGKRDVEAVLRRISTIYVSHLHADHHIGFIQLLKERRRAFVNHGESKFAPVTLLAPGQILSYLQSYDECIEPILNDFRLFGNVNFFPEMDKASNEQYVDLLTDLNLKTVDMVYVKHCSHAFGVALTHRTGWKLVYSGDTMPCGALIGIGKNCDVLIHEATMEDDLKDEAISKRHSCTSEAIEVGKRMNAKFILLTHFSQRYAKVPLYNDNFKENVGIAFDNMRVTFADLCYLPHFTDALMAMFSEEYEDMQEKTAKKKRRQVLAAKELMKSAENGGN